MKVSEVTSSLKRVALQLRDAQPIRQVRRTLSGASGMNVLVVHPQYPGQPHIRYLPLGLAMVAAIAEREGHDVRVLDLLNQALPYSALEDELRRRRYQLVMAGGFAMQVASMREIVERVRRHSEGTQVLLGGVGVSDIPEIALEYTGADAVCTHEAEMVLPDILRAVQEGRTLDECFGVVFRKDGKIVRRPGGSISEDLDALPYPAYHLFDIDGIAPHSYNGWGAKKSIHIQTSRGCPFACTFCINSLLNDKEYKKTNFGGNLTTSKKSMRFRSPESLVKEIEFLRDRYGITDFHFADEEFITGTDHLLKTCAALKKANVTWSTSGRADWVDEEKLSAMKDAGCRYIIFGIESGSQKIVDLMDKKAKVARVAAGILACYKVGMRFIPNFMIGYPGETKETIMETVAFCKALKLPFNAAFVTPFPNSKMFHRKKQTLGDWQTYFERLSKVDYGTTVFAQLSDIAPHDLVSLRARAHAECAKSAATEYNVDFSKEINPERWGPLPPASGPVLTELPAMFRKDKAATDEGDGFEMSMAELEVRPTGMTMPVAHAVALDRVDIGDDWVGARRVSSAPLQLETASSEWGYSGLFQVDEQALRQAQERLVGGRLWLSVSARTIRGRVGVGMLDLEGGFQLEEFLDEGSGSVTQYFPVPAQGVRGVLFRSGGIGSSLVEISDITLLIEDRSSEGMSPPPPGGARASDHAAAL